MLSFGAFYWVLLSFIILGVLLMCCRHHCSTIVPPGGCLLSVWHGIEHAAGTIGEGVCAAATLACPPMQSYPCCSLAFVPHCPHVLPSPASIGSVLCACIIVFLKVPGGGAPPPAGLTQLSRAEPDCWGHHWQGLCVPVTVAGCGAYMSCI